MRLRELTRHHTVYLRLRLGKRLSASEAAQTSEDDVNSRRLSGDLYVLLIPEYPGGFVGNSKTVDANFRRDAHAAR
jgi:hypothetical protein